MKPFILFNGVTYVSKMQNNLTSLGKLNSKGNNFTTPGGTMKLTINSMVLVNGRKYDTIDHLVGNIVISGDPMVSIIS